MVLSQEQKNFIKIVGTIAAADAIRSGVLASLTIAQAILESAWGKSTLTVKANALFGIKATSAWKGKAYNTKTQECYDGVNYETVDACFRAYSSWKESIADHSAFLAGAARYKAVVGEQDYKTACRAIKAAGYATDPTYADKLISIIEQFALTAYDTAKQDKGGDILNIIQYFITNNDCYKKNLNKAGASYTTFQSRGPLGLMLHSVGCSQPKASVFIKTWNQPGKAVACHGLIEPDGTVYLCMPLHYRGWHGASGAKGSVNDTHLGFEMTEPATINYTDGAMFTDSDPTKTKAHVLGTYKTAVELFAHLCKELKLDPSKDGVIISHSEGCQRGIASKHADVEHIWSKFGLTMNQFRQDVKDAMSGKATPTPVQPTLVPPPQPIQPSTAIKTGDNVHFAGGSVYASSSAAQATTTKPASICRVTQTGSGKHAYHLISQDGKGIFGWVDAACVSK